MTNGASRSITAKAAANIRSAERASIDNGNVEKGLASKGLELPNGGEFAVFVGFNLFAGLIGYARTASHNSRLGVLFFSDRQILSWGDQHGSVDRTDEVTLSRKGAKSRRRITGLRSKTTKARTHVDRLRAANADLKKKLAEALEQQTATSEVLKVISSSLGELQPVFQTILENATRICDAQCGNLYLCEGDA